jgi:hypothetical protein
MPVRKVKGGFKYGKKGKTYPTKKLAAKQGRAIQASKAATQASKSAGKKK